MATLCSPVLSALDPPVRSRLLLRAVPRELERGDVLVLAGAPSRRIYAVARGVVKLVARSQDGRESIVALAAAGDLVGEVALLVGDREPLDAIAATRCEVHSLDGPGFLEALASSPAAAIALARSEAERFRWASAAAFERHRVVSERLAGRLLDLAELLGRVRGGVIELDLPLAQGELAELAGMCRESACKALRRMRAEGVLDYRGRRLRILRPDALERMRCAGPGLVEKIPGSPSRSP